LLNATVGVHRLIDRLRSEPISLAPRAAVLRRRGLVAARRLRHRLLSLAVTLRLASSHAASPVHRTFQRAAAQPRSAAHRIRAGAHRPGIGAHRRSIADRIATSPASLGRAVRGLPAVAGHDRLLPVGVGFFLVAAAVISVNGIGDVRGGIGDARGGVARPEATPRITVAGLAEAAALEQHYELAAQAEAAEAARLNDAQVVAALGDVGEDFGATEAILWKPIVVSTAIADGRDLLRRYKVRAGDTLTGIANRFDVSMMTIWWANNLKRKDDLKVGQTLIIPPTSGLVVTVKEGDTLDAIAKTNRVSKHEIFEFNGLEDEVLVAGQVLVLPGARGEAIKVPKPKPVARSTSRAGGGRVTGTPVRYTGGAFRWPVPGGRIVQYFHYGHYALDISGDYGDPVLAAAGGTVTFAGWKSNGGGYQVWIAHGSGLYTTYNHMSGVSVGRGAHVGKGQRVGRIGCSGWCTGPHLHFEVWKGPIWNGGVRVNPLNYL
jgi:murein DD-endopeptidase MepM/ murein hydrolase activator NlpD